MQSKVSNAREDHFMSFSGALLSLVLIFSVITAYQGRKQREKLQVFMDRNGGLLLYDKARNEKGAASTSAGFRIFMPEELRAATSNFDSSLEIGRGSRGTTAVYDGFVDGLGRVAIKKASGEAAGIRIREELVSEMLVLSQLNHKNIVKLLGCSLDDKAAMLVYELVHNGTLFSHLHGAAIDTDVMSFDTRLRIAAEAAEALAYAVSSASPAVVHGDFKSKSVLLDDKFRVKVSGFVRHSVAGDDDTELAWLVMGTSWYLNPEFRQQTRAWTEKSDVYDFGVVLFELITGKEAANEGGGVSEFLAAINGDGDDRLEMLLDEQVKKEAEEGVLRELVELAGRCLSVRAEERPTMKQVAGELASLRCGTGEKKKKGSGLGELFEPGSGEWRSAQPGSAMLLTQKLDSESTWLGIGSGLGRVAAESNSSQ